MCSSEGWNEIFRIIITFFIFSSAGSQMDDLIKKREEKKKNTVSLPFWIEKRGKKSTYYFTLYCHRRRQPPSRDSNQKTWVEEVEADTIVTSLFSPPRAVSFKSVRLATASFPQFFSSNIKSPSFQTLCFFYCNFHYLN